MKKNFRLFGRLLPMLAAVALFTACGDDNGDDDPTVLGPGITFDGVDGEEADVAVGEEISFNVLVNAAGGFNRLVVEKTVGSGTSETIADTSRAAGQTTNNFTYNFSYTPVAEEAGQQIYFDFTAVDDDGLDNTVTFTVNVGEVQLSEYQTVLLGGQLNSTTGSFYNSTENTVYTYSEASNNKESVDLLYYYVTSGTNPALATLAAPSNSAARTTFSGEGLSLEGMDNATQFKSSTATYADVDTYDELVNAFEGETSGTADTRVTNLEVGDVVAFQLDETRGSRYGIAEVVSIEGTSGADRSITLNVKVQASDI